MPAEFSILRRVQFAETDMAGVAHFSSYFRWMEETEHAFFRSVGLSVVMQHQGMEIGWPRVTAACEYFAPARFEDELELKLRAVRVGDKSFSYEVDVAKGDQKIAMGKVTSICCISRPNEGFKSISIPSEIREKLTT